MRTRTSIWQGQNKFAMLRFILVFVGYTLGLFTIITFNQYAPGPDQEVPEVMPLPVFLGLVFGWIIYSILSISIGFVYPMYIDRRKQREANEIECACEGTVKLGKSPSEYMLLPFIYVEEIIIDWNDDKIREFMKTREGTRVKQILERKVGLEDYLSLRKFIQATEEKAKTKKEPTEGDATKFQIELPFEELFTQLQEGFLNIDRKKIESLHFYIGLLSEDECFEGFETTPFRRVVQITREPREKVLKTYSRRVLDSEDYEVNVHHVYTHHICHGLLSNGIPVLFLQNSENMAEEQTNLVLNAQELNYIEIHVLRYLLNEKIFLNESGKQALEAERNKAEAYRTKWALTAQQWELFEEHIGTGIDTVDMRNLKYEIESLKKYKILTGILGIIVIILVVVLMLIVGGTQNVPESDMMLLPFFLLKNIPTKLI